MSWRTAPSKQQSWVDGPGPDLAGDLLSHCVPIKYNNMPLQHFGRAGMDIIETPVMNLSYALVHPVGTKDLTLRWTLDRAIFPSSTLSSRAVLKTLQ